MVNELINKVIQWGRDKGITDPKAQMTKVIEEFSELNSTVFQEDEPEIIDALGDLQVTLIILMDTIGGKVKEVELEDEKVDLQLILSDIGFLNSSINKDVHLTLFFESFVNKAIARVQQYAETLGYDAMECLQVAYDVISKRKGKNVNGVFVKDDE